MSERLEKGDWRDPYDPEFEEWVWELRTARTFYPNLRPDLQPRDSDDYPLRAEAVSAIKEKESFS